MLVADDFCAVRTQAQKSGDLRSLSLCDMEVMALAWQLHCEATGTLMAPVKTAAAATPAGQPQAAPKPAVAASAFKTGAWGPKPAAEAAATPIAIALPAEPVLAPTPAAAQKPVITIEGAGMFDDASSDEDDEEGSGVAAKPAAVPEEDPAAASANTDTAADVHFPALGSSSEYKPPLAIKRPAHEATEPEPEPEPEPQPQPQPQPDEGLEVDDDEDELSDDGDGEWITPKNISRVREKHAAKNMQPVEKEEQVIGAACISADFAMQNVMMRMGIKVLSMNGMVIKKAKQFVLKCNACFNVIYKMESAFCDRCGSDFLMKVSMTIDKKGRVFFSKGSHRAKSIRGTKFSIAKPKHDAGARRIEEKVILREDEMLMGSVGGRSSGSVRKAAYQGGTTIFDSTHTNRATDAFGGTRLVVGSAGKNPNVKARSKKMGGSGRKRSGR